MVNNKTTILGGVIDTGSCIYEVDWILVPHPTPGVLFGPPFHSVNFQQKTCQQVWSQCPMFNDAIVHVISCYHSISSVQLTMIKWSLTEMEIGFAKMERETIK